MSDISRMLAETADRLLTQFGKRSVEEPDRATLLDAVHAAGLHLVLVPEDAGGAGLELEEAAEIVRVWGRYAAMLPIVELLIASRLAAQFGGDLAAGSVASCDLVLAMDGDTPKLSGRSIEAPLLPGCKRLYARATNASRDRFIVSVATTNAQTFATLTGEPWLRLAPEKALGVRALAVESLEFERIEREGALLTAAALNGAMSEVLTLLIDYVNTRSQFGRPIGRFQAVQHLIADIAGELAASEAVLSDALRKPFDRLGWLSAKVQAARAATAVASVSHQLFGAIGFTAEHVLHHYTKRLWTWRDDWGRQSDCERSIGEMAMQSGEGGLWSFLVDRPEAIARQL